LFLNLYFYHQKREENATSELIPKDHSINYKVRLIL